jgi:hypothetical protein
MNNVVEKMLKWSWPNLRHYTGIFLEVLWKTTTKLSRDSWYLGQNMSPLPPVHEAAMLTIRQRKDALFYTKYNGN